MALINCKDCNKEISESAAACPSCGSPIERKVHEGEEQCPFCSTILPGTAMVCTGCEAQKGYGSSRGGDVFSKGQIIGWGILFPLILSTFGFMADFMFGSNVGTIVLLVMLFSAGIGVWRLIRGPIWWRTTNVHNS